MSELDPSCWGNASQPFSAFLGQTVGCRQRLWPPIAGLLDHGAVLS